VYLFTGEGLVNPLHFLLANIYTLVGTIYQFPHCARCTKAGGRMVGDFQVFLSIVVLASPHVDIKMDGACQFSFVNLHKKAGTCQVTKKVSYTTVHNSIPLIYYTCKQLHLQTAHDQKGDTDMKLKYKIYQLRCKLANKPDIDYIEFVARTIFIRGGVRV